MANDLTLEQIDAIIALFDSSKSAPHLYRQLARTMRENAELREYNEALKIERDGWLSKWTEVSHSKVVIEALPIAATGLNLPNAVAAMAREALESIVAMQNKKP